MMHTAKIEFHLKPMFRENLFPILMTWKNFQSLWFGSRNWWVIETVLDGFYRYFALVAKVKSLGVGKTNKLS